MSPLRTSTRSWIRRSCCSDTAARIARCTPQAGAEGPLGLARLIPVAHRDIGPSDPNLADPPGRAGLERLGIDDDRAGHWLAARHQGPRIVGVVGVTGARDDLVTL